MRFLFIFILRICVLCAFTPLRLHCYLLSHYSLFIQYLSQSVFVSVSVCYVVCFFAALCKFFVNSILSLFAEHTQINLLSSSHRILLFTKYRNARLNLAQQANIISINSQESTNIKFKASLKHTAEYITHHKRT